ncbi:MAG: TRAP transporter small permease [Desulfobacteraceae bacterium]|jgi:TRAP-type C4-dicarboxylate transport system permease small subunit|nr:TRAP transporter small permease [Desulfobacteraceae bacterium]
MNFFWKIVQWILDKMKIIGAACLVGMMMLTCVDVVGRAFGHPVFGSVEIVGFMAILSVVMAMPYTHQVQGHIGVEIIVRLFSEKTQTIIDIWTGITSLILFAIVTWRMTVYANTMKASGEVSMNLELPEYGIIYMTAFCLLIFTLIILKDILNNIRKLKST